MKELGAASAAAELDQLQWQLAKEQQQIEHLKQRIRLAEVDIASWRPARKRALGGSAKFGFVVGLTTTLFIGKIIAEVLAR